MAVGVKPVLAFPFDAVDNFTKIFTLGEALVSGGIPLVFA